MDHIPPPPYSETDPGTTIVTPTTSHADNASLPAPSAASSADDSVIFTPPYSPTESAHQSLGDDLDHVSSSAATAYFESRPAQTRAPPIPKVYAITITSTTEPKDIPYPEPAQEWLSKDVTEQDWATFINYVLPDHTASVNNDVADRKLKAELIDERMRRLTLGPEDRSRTDLTQVDAQLEPLRQQLSPQSAEWLTKVDATISEWNAGFFEPRGFQIRFIEPEISIENGNETRGMPGAWIPYDHEILEDGEARGPRKGFSFAGIEANSRGFRFGPIRADNEGFRIGKNGIVADGRGFRLGNMLVADQNGFRLGGSRGFVADGNGVTLGGRVFGRRDDRDRDIGHGHGHGGRRGHHSHHGHRGHGRGRSHDYGRHGRRRGRSSSTSSASSTSSSSSSSSSDSDSSLGSLPEYHDLKDQQLPTAKQSLMDWLNHPEQPITRETVQNFKQEIKVAKKSNPQQFDQDMKVLRKEVKDLFKEFKEAKKAQNIFRKQVRKEKRTAKRAAKKERRAAKKEERRQRRGKDKEDLNPHAPGFVPAVPGMPHHPAMGHMAAMHSMPKLPLVPGARAGFPFGGRGPFGKGPPFGRSATGPPGMAMHGGWPFARGLSNPTCPLSDHTGGMGGPISHSASQIHTQAQHMDEEAKRKEMKAVDLRASSTGRRVGEKEKLKKIDEAEKLEEEAEKFRREAERLRAEATHLDGEIARQMEDEEGQATGVIQH